MRTIRIARGYLPSKITAALGDEGLLEVAEGGAHEATGSPEAIGGIALYLASKASGFRCGAVIPVDGGLATTADRHIARAHPLAGPLAA